MPGTCIVGLQWGDEAKGKLVDLLTDGHRLVVRYQGGANAGHTVVVGSETYKLHHIPSGILNDGVLNLVTAGVVVSPPTILDEIESLQKRGIELRDRLVLSQRAHVVFPWHVLEDRLWSEFAEGVLDIGTTLRGIGPCYRDKVGRTLAIRLGDLTRPNFQDRVRQVGRIKLEVLQAMNRGQSVEIDLDEICSQYSGYARRLEPFIGDTTSLLLDAVDRNEAILYEGAQGALLDIDHGTFPYVTSSNSSGVGVTAGSGVPAKAIDKVIGVAKAYTTRVGQGPMPTELKDDIGAHIRQRGREYGTTTGRARRCGWFDAFAVRYTTRLSGADALAVMMLDVLSELPEIKICIGYRLDGQRLDRFPSDAQDLAQVEPIYETLPGWQSEITAARRLDDLPQAALDYVARVSQLVQVPVEFISVGPDRRQTIFCNRAELAPTG